MKTAGRVTWRSPRVSSICRVQSAPWTRGGVTASSKTRSRPHLSALDLHFTRSVRLPRRRPRRHHRAERSHAARPRGASVTRSHVACSKPKPLMFQSVTHHRSRWMALSEPEFTCPQRHKLVRENKVTSTPSSLNASGYFQKSQVSARIQISYPLKRFVWGKKKIVFNDFSKWNKIILHSGAFPTLR